MLAVVCVAILAIAAAWPCISDVVRRRRIAARNRRMTALKSYLPKVKPWGIQMAFGVTKKASLAKFRAQTRACAGLIGKGIAHGLLRAGATVVVNSRHPSRLSDLAEELGHPEKLALFYIPSRHVAKAEKLPRDYSKALEAFQCPLSPAATEMVAKLKKYMRVLLKTVLAVAPKVGVVM